MKQLKSFSLFTKLLIGTFLLILVIAPISVLKNKIRSHLQEQKLYAVSQKLGYTKENEVGMFTDCYGIVIDNFCYLHLVFLTQDTKEQFISKLQLVTKQPLKEDIQSAYELSNYINQNTHHTIKLNGDTTKDLQASWWQLEADAKDTSLLDAEYFDSTVFDSVVLDDVPTHQNFVVVRLLISQ
jgi:hypothetical protein